MEFFECPSSIAHDIRYTILRNFHF